MKTSQKSVPDDRKPDGVSGPLAAVTVMPSARRNLKKLDPPILMKTGKIAEEAVVARSQANLVKRPRAPHQREGVAKATKRFYRREPTIEIVGEDGNVPEPETSLYSANDHSAFYLYLREVGQTKLLTRQEEMALAKRVQKGDKQAHDQMIKANLRLVVKIARDYADYGVPLLDLISEGNIGLMKAVKRFDPMRGAKFSTYGSWWIKQAIRRALSNQSKTIRLPVHVVDKLAHLRKATVKLQDLLGREPTDEELAQELDTTAVRINRLRRASIQPASLDAPLGDDDSSRIADIVQDEKALTPYEQLESETNVGLVRQLVETLNPREAAILRQRFGLGDEDKKTLEEIGEQFGLTRERIRQIEAIALGKLRKKIEDLETVQFAA